MKDEAPGSLMRAGGFFYRDNVNQNRGRCAPHPALLFVLAATKSKQKMPFHCVEHACSTFFVH
jgi:hypothetical protein